MKKNNNKKKQRRSNRRAAPYSLSGHSSRYGPGRNFRIINNDRQALGGDITRISLHEDLMNSGEYYNLGNSYRYFKVEFIRVVLFPVNLTDDPGRIYLNISWQAIEMTESDIKKDDSTKMTSAYRTQNKTFTWRPPNMVIQVNSIMQEHPLNFMNPGKINSILKNNNVNPYPGWLWIMNTSSADLKFDLQFGVLFLGNDFGGVAGKGKMIDRATMFKSVSYKIKQDLEEDPSSEAEEDLQLKKKPKKK